MASHSRRIGVLTAAALVLSAQLAGAQAPSDVPTPVRAWTLGGSTGVASVDDTAGVALGGAFSWHFAPRWAIEIGGQWLNRPDSQEAWAVEATTQFRLLSDARHVPFVRAGVAAYTTTFDGRAIHAMPTFYRRRMPAGQSQSWFARRHSFTDPAIVLGGGLDLEVTTRLRVRPSIEVLTALDNGNALVTPIAQVQVAYHFETGRVTPARGR